MGEEWRDRTALQAAAKKPSDEFMARYQAYYGRLPGGDEAVIRYWKAFAAKVPAALFDRLFAYVTAEQARRKGGTPHLAVFEQALSALRRSDNPHSASDRAPREACALCDGTGWMTYLVSVDMTTGRRTLAASPDDPYITTMAAPCFCSRGLALSEGLTNIDEVERQAAKDEILRRGGKDGYQGYSREL